MPKSKKYFNFTRDDLSSLDPFERNEVRANLNISNFMCLLGIVSIITIILAITGVYDINSLSLIFIGAGSFLIFAPSLICQLKKGRGKAYKYVIIGQFLIYSAVIRAFVGDYGILLIAAGIVLSARYFDKKFNMLMVVIALISFVISEFCYCIFSSPSPLIGKSLVEMTLTSNGKDYVYTLKEGTLWTYIGLVWRYNGLPYGTCMLLVSSLSYGITVAGRKLVDDKSKQLASEALVSSELEMAKEIQKSMLPKKFPLFPEYEDINVYAIMNPAKEVGGDFYDAFVVDEDHVAFLIADVSGKGIPAAMFMALAKAIIKTQEIASIDPGKSFYAINNALREGNDINFFVTAWLGVMNTKTAELKYVNAGHNPPLFARKNNKYEFLTQVSGPVLTAVSNFPYKVHTLQLEKGDRIFLYTDGVTEAENAIHEQYGAKRLKEFLCNEKRSSIRSIVKHVEDDVERFAQDVPQSDDLTILMFEYGSFSKTFPCEEENIPLIIDVCNRYFAKYGANPRTISQVDVVLDEALANIFHYAYKPEEKGTISISINFESDTNEFTLVVADRGKEFNPLLKEDPDTTLPSEERQIGGLGIYMVKKLVDSIEYYRFEDENILVMTKKI